MSKMQRDKGAAFERLVARICNEALGTDLSRNLTQYQEVSGRDLVSSDDGFRFCIQCEHAKMIHVCQKLQEARESAKDGEMPVAIIRRDREPITATMELEDWLTIVAGALRWEELMVKLHAAKADEHFGRKCPVARVDNVVALCATDFEDWFGALDDKD